LRRRRGRVGSRILQSTAALPAMFTILNALFGFAAIHFATKGSFGTASLANLSLAAWLIVAAMVCDMLDGRLARLSRKTSDFGAQLDSLSDVVSFGVAPAMLMLCTVAKTIQEPVERLQFMQQFPVIERVIWGIAAVYVACAVLRLARFNVESEPDESAHMTFKGLPAPGAAAVITALVLLFTNLADTNEGWLSSEWLLAVVGICLPVLTLAVALLMVSSLHYSHIVNQYIRGRRPFSYLVKLTVILIAAYLHVYITGAVLAVAFVLSGPSRFFWQWPRSRRGLT